MDEDRDDSHFTGGMDSLAAERDQEVVGVPSGFPKLDDLTGGWQDSNLIVIGGRPTMGKTSLALSAAQHAAVDRDPPTGVVIFSLEMGGTQVAQRLITSRAQFDAQEARTGPIDDEDRERLEEAARELSNSPLHIDDTPRLSVEDLADKCRRLVEERDVGLIVVDYLQLLRASGSNLPNSVTRERELGYLTRELKALAKELDLPVIVLSQLNREVENRGGAKRPKLTDLRGSGSIEQDADVVAFIYRAERYGITVNEGGNSTEDVAEVIVEKQRNGPVGIVELAFKKQYARFEPHSEIDRSPESKDGGNATPSSGGDSFEDDAPF